MADIIFITLKLATISTMVLLILGIPLAWWLANVKHWGKDVVSTLVALPLVLPPTVLGFYLLVALSPNGVFSRILEPFGIGALAFSFSGLVVGSVIYSLPFVVNPIRNAFESFGSAPMEAAATLRATPFDRFVSVALPLASPGILTGAILGFAHTIGEFGVVLMIGGNIPGETKVLSMAILDYVETLDWASAHLLSGLMLGFSFCVILAMTILEKSLRKRWA